ncbi:MAG TPA: hypothetical protein VGK48_00205 [Terriglobia bacterium]
MFQPDQLPETWGPPGRIHQTLSQAAWSPAEAADAEHAVRRGLDELAQFFDAHPDIAATLDTDTVESLIDPAYAAGNMPELRAEARAAATKALNSVAAPYLAGEPATASCDDAERLLKFSAFAQQLGPSTSRTAKMAAFTNSALRACGSLAGAMGYDYHQKLNAAPVTNDDLWGMVMWSIEFTDAQAVPGLNLPAGAAALPSELWRFLSHYPLTGARAYPDGARNQTFRQTAYLVTHLAYIPTGYGRYSIYLDDAPYLYRFLRENFYPVLEMGELDLTAEFVDLFRQYGCTEKNDLQVRDGTRYLLKLFHSAHDTWMDYREPDEPAAISDYDRIHKPWTGISGVRARVPEPAAPGTYGSVVRAWMGAPH